jgi:hypothetical protein
MAYLNMFNTIDRMGKQPRVVKVTWKQGLRRRAVSRGGNDEGVGDGAG